LKKGPYSKTTILFIKTANGLF